MKSKMSMYKINSKLKMRSLTTSAAENLKPSEKQSVITKTASALKSKYSSIITTRRAAAKTHNTSSTTDSNTSQESVPQGVFSFSNKDAFTPKSKQLELNLKPDQKVVVIKPKNTEIMKRLQVTLDKIHKEEAESTANTDDDNSDEKTLTDTSVSNEKSEENTDSKTDSAKTNPEQGNRNSESVIETPKVQDPKSKTEDSEADDNGKKVPTSTSTKQSDSREESVTQTQKQTSKPADLETHLNSGTPGKEDVKPVTTQGEMSDFISASQKSPETTAKTAETPKKKNPFLDNLVASCKTKLGYPETEVCSLSQMINKKGSKS